MNQQYLNEIDRLDDIKISTNDNFLSIQEKFNKFVTILQTYNKIEKRINNNNIVITSDEKIMLQQPSNINVEETKIIYENSVETICTPSGAFDGNTSNNIDCVYNGTKDIGLLVNVNPFNEYARTNHLLYGNKIANGLDTEYETAWTQSYIHHYDNKLYHLYNQNNNNSVLKKYYVQTVSFKSKTVENPSVTSKNFTSRITKLQFFDKYLFYIRGNSTVTYLTVFDLKDLISIKTFSLKDVDENDIPYQTKMYFTYQNSNIYLFYENEAEIKLSIYNSILSQENETLIATNESYINIVFEDNTFINIAENFINNEIYFSIQNNTRKYYYLIKLDNNLLYKILKFYDSNVIEYDKNIFNNDETSTKMTYKNINNKGYLIIQQKVFKSRAEYLSVLKVYDIDSNTINTIFSVDSLTSITLHEDNIIIQKFTIKGSVISIVRNSFNISDIQIYLQYNTKTEGVIICDAKLNDTSIQTLYNLTSRVTKNKKQVKLFYYKKNMKTIELYKDIKNFNLSLLFDEQI